VERNLLKINEKSSIDFEKKKKDGKNNFYILKKFKKLEKEKSKRKNYFREIRAKRSAPKSTINKM